ncbi:MAG TPA: MltA domain-containing protein [Caulobacteraceae bacterium]|nr:MltA domain-containing protein [Caulobacteraceae bacterium]
MSSGRPIPLQALPGWEEEDHRAAFAALMAACELGRDPGLSDVCDLARRIDPPDEATARGFLERWLVALPVPGPGLLTAYFSPVFAAARVPGGDFTAPVRSPPDRNKAAAQLDRASIEASAAPHALAWMRPEDLFFLQIQGSGILVFSDGGWAQARFAGSNGAPYVAIGAAMRSEGLLAPGAASASDIHRWLADHRGPEADRIMDLDPRYVYFRLTLGDAAPIGSAGAPLLSGRSLAVDTQFHPLGELFWIDADGTEAEYRRVVVALDTGGAIRGPSRADLYLGRGAQAGVIAGRVRADLRLYQLAPADATP